MTRYQIRAELDPSALQELFDASWPAGPPRYRPGQLERSLAWVSAHDSERLIGFVNVAWDGGVHAFVLDTTVHPDYRRRRIGAELVGRALTVARAAGCTWLHVDFEPELARFYESCGFEPTAAGLLRL